MKLGMYDVLLRPAVTEKMTMQQEKQNKYAFEVHCHANKHQIREAIEKIFNVHVVKINTATHKGKWRRVRREPGKTAISKRAFVTIKEGEKIDITI